MKKTEPTPEQVVFLRRAIPTRIDFINALLNLGFNYLSEGCFKQVYAYPRGKYVVKVANSDGNYRDPTPMGRSITVRSRAKDKSKYLPILAAGPGVHVQRRVKECRNVDCGVNQIPDSYGKNHTHIGTRKVLFDY